MQEMIKVAIVELGGSHDECIYSQVKILKSVEDIHVTVICNSSLAESVQYFDSVDHIHFVRLRKNKLLRRLDIYRLWKYCRKEKFDKIVFNTAHGKTIKHLLILPMPKGTLCYGIIHDATKLHSSYTQKRISAKIHHYFLLNAYLLSTLPARTDKEFSIFHPIFFPQYPAVHVEKSDEVWICIPGQVELKRRDYESLFQSIKLHGINKNVKFLLLGRCGHSHGDGAYIKQKIREMEIGDHFRLWDDFIPVPEFHAMVKKSDFILPLIHTGTASGKLYTTQISGSYNLAVGYQKPMLVEENLGNSLLQSYEPITYVAEELMLTINALTPVDRAVYTDDMWSFTYQRDTYLKALGITQE